MNHYFTDNRQLEHDRKEISFRFLGILFSFVTDSGVFSKDRVDTGSAILLEAVVKQPLGTRILDYGCGYGVIGIVLARQLAVSVVAADVNQRALQLTEENAKRNGVNLEVVLVAEEDGFYGKFTSVILNPPIRAGKEIIYQMFEKAQLYLEDKGSFYIVMRKQHGAESAVRKLHQLFPIVEIIKREKGYQVIKAIKGLDNLT